MKDLIPSLGDVNAVIGTQWGDEGKGKITDILAEHHDVIARSCGGANAGHTIIVGDKKHVFHLLPSGCLHPDKEIILGSGMVIHLQTLLDEIEQLRNVGIDIVPRLHISSAAHVVFDYHKDIDASLELKRAEKQGKGIGTTKRGIGPAYMDKAERTGVRMDQLEKAVRTITNRVSEADRVYGVHIDTEKEVAAIKAALEQIGNRIVDTVDRIHRFKKDNKRILVEGAQASMLDIDHGTYPYVTSSSTTAAGALQGLGLPPSALHSVIGVVKAYCTRVGEGAFLTEAHGEEEETLRDRGGEYGATTGRPRRCGWLSIPDLKRAIQINGITHLNLTKLDVLDSFESIPVAVSDEENLTFEELPGWNEPTVGKTSFDGLPPNAQNYIKFIAERTSTPVSFIGTGPERKDMITQ